MAEREKSSRGDFTLFVNNCVVPKENAHQGYELCVESTIFKEWHTDYNDRYGKDVQSGEPYELFGWRVCQGNFEALDSMIARGIVKKRKGKDRHHIPIY